MKAELHEKDCHVTIEVTGLISSIETLVEMAFYGMMAQGYHPETVLNAMYAIAEERSQVKHLTG